MAFPLLLAAALGLTGASTIANKVGADKQRQAHSQAVRRQERRQDRIDEQRDGVNDRAQRRYKDFEGQQGDKAGELADLYAPSDESPSTAMLAPSESAVTNRAVSDASGRAREEVGERGRQRADLESFGSVFGDIGVQEARDMSELEKLYSFQRGWETPYALELDAAAQAGQGWRTFGDITGGLGSIAMTAGLGAPGAAGGQGIFGGRLGDLPGLHGWLNPGRPRGVVNAPLGRPEGLFG